MTKYLVPLSNDDENSWSTFVAFVDVNEELIAKAKAAHALAVQGQKTIQDSYICEVKIPLGDVEVCEKHRLDESLSDEICFETIKVDTFPKIDWDKDDLMYDNPDSNVYMEIDSINWKWATLICFGYSQRYVGQLCLEETDANI